MYKPIQLQSSNIPSVSTTNSLDFTDNFTFLTNLFRSSLHSDIKISYQNHQYGIYIKVFFHYVQYILMNIF